jgi:Ohr subfamily peroxiredoxin
MNAITPVEKVVFTGKTHNVAGPDGFARSADGFLDIKVPQPHPAAENLFGAAWSACFMGAVQLAAAQKTVKLAGEPEVDAEIDLNVAAGSYFLRARLNVTVPGVDRAVAEELVEIADQICPYSKAVRGNIDVTITVL